MIKTTTFSDTGNSLNKKDNILYLFGILLSALIGFALFVGIIVLIMKYIVFNVFAFPGFLSIFKIFIFVFPLFILIALCCFLKLQIIKLKTNPIRKFCSIFLNVFVVIQFYLFTNDTIYLISYNIEIEKFLFSTYFGQSNLFITILCFMALTITMAFDKNVDEK